MYYNKNDIYHRDRYEGEWKNNLMEGKGTLYWNSKSRYEGDWKNGKREGKGILYFIFNVFGNQYTIIVINEVCKKYKKTILNYI